ncbi:MAG: sulfatase [Planctomycetota bacterium]|jgi:arylsulfatase A-like enzyme
MTTCKKILIALFGILNLIPLGCKPEGNEFEQDGFNVILISLDTLRQDRLGCYGYGLPVSENIDRLAGGGVLFENAVTPSPWTLPAHASLFTALYPPAHGVVRKELAIPPSQLTLSEILKSNEYSTGAFCGSGFMNSIYGFARGFDIYQEDQTGRLHNILPPALEWLKANHENEFYLFIHCYDAHFPYFPEDEHFREKYTKNFDRVPLHRVDALITRWNQEGRLNDQDLDELLFCMYKYFDKINDLYKKEMIKDKVELTDKLREYVGSKWPASPHYQDDLAMIRGFYDGEVESIDHQLGKLFDLLTELKLWEKTLVVILSDHGEAFMEHDMLGHTWNLFDELIKIPLIMVFPGDEYDGLRQESIVRIIDVMPTLLDFLEIDLPEDLTIQGKSLMPMISGRDMNLSAFAVSFDGDACLVWDDHKLILDINNKNEELYDLAADPAERNNLIRDKQEVGKDLLQKIKVLQKQNRRFLKKMTPEKVHIDPELKKQLRELGYM